MRKRHVVLLLLGVGALGAWGFAFTRGARAGRIADERAARADEVDLMRARVDGLEVEAAAPPPPPPAWRLADDLHRPLEFVRECAERADAAGVALARIDAGAPERGRFVLALEGGADTTRLCGLLAALEPDYVLTRLKVAPDAKGALRFEAAAAVYGREPPPPLDEDREEEDAE